MTAQLDLFGEVLAAEAAVDQAAADLAAWTARFERVTFPAPYATSFDEKGAEILGWRCPACGLVEWGPYQLWINHGFDPDRAGVMPYGVEWNEDCTRLRLLACRGERPPWGGISGMDEAE